MSQYKNRVDLILDESMKGVLAEKIGLDVRSVIETVRSCIND